MKIELIWGVDSCLPAHANCQRGSDRVMSFQAIREPRHISCSRCFYLGVLELMARKKVLTQSIAIPRRELIGP